ncbi:MAG TPA: ABC transporter transmembrane domain-containing protein [Gemmataceae bacterium]|nr:ABC transporter transmembrane domain-containing protein [Gemmataceae bacterium]
MARHSRRGRDTDDEELPPVKLTAQTLRDAGRLARYLWPYRFKFGAALLFLMLSSLLGLAFPYVTGSLVDGALTHKAGPVPWDRNINLITLALLGVLAGQAALSFLQSLWLTEVGERSLADLRRDTYARLVRLPMAFHTKRRVGELSSRIAADLSQIQGTLIGSFPDFLRQVATLVGGVALIAWTSWRLTLVMMASLPALMVVAVLFGRALRRVSKQAQDRLAESNVIVEETLQGIASVKAFSNERFEEGRYRGSLDTFLKEVIRGAWYRGAFISFVVFALFGSIVVVLWYGARQVQAGDLTAGELTRFMLYTLFVGGAMGSFAELYSQIQRTLGATQRVRELLREEPEEDEELRAPSVSEGFSGKRLRGDVVFDDVGFSYPSRKEVEVLRGASLEAHAGQRVALVGPSGAGKSTVVALLLRFYEPDRGRILIDGRDARDYGLHELRSQMAIVPQDVLLFGGTVGENIAYGRPGASDEEVVEAARKANAHDFISSFPEGYRTRVGERGVQLSGGQRQRVAIARAILRDPAILILDEATSSLDAESESLVLQALDRLMQGRTALIIAHRLSTVRRADRIYVLKDGRTVESGTHDELVAQEGGIYRTFSRLQLEHPGPTPLDQEDDGWPTEVPLPPTP